MLRSDKRTGCDGKEIKRFFLSFFLLTFLIFSISKCGRFTSGCTCCTARARLTNHVIATHTTTPSYSFYISLLSLSFYFHSPLRDRSFFGLFFFFLNIFFHSKWIKWRRLEASSYWHHPWIEEGNSKFQFDRPTDRLFSITISKRHEYASRFSPMDDKSVVVVVECERACVCRHAPLRQKNPDLAPFELPLSTRLQFRTEKDKKERTPHK